MAPKLKEENDENIAIEKEASSKFAVAKQQIRDAYNQYKKYNQGRPLSPDAAKWLLDKIHKSHNALQCYNDVLIELYTESSNESIRKDFAEHVDLYLEIKENCNALTEARSKEKEAARLERQRLELEKLKLTSGNKKKKKTDGEDEENEDDDEDDGSDSEEEDNSRSRFRTIRMPETKIPMFSGDYKKWHEFRDMFVGSVKKQRMPTIQKYHILRMHLEGEAKRTVEGLSLTEDSFKDAWDMLKERYGNDRELFRTYVRELDDFRGPVQDFGESPRALCDAITSFRSNAIRLGGDGDFPAEAFLITLLERKLSPEARRWWDLEIQQIIALLPVPAEGEPKDTAKLTKITLKHFLAFLKKRGDIGKDDNSHARGNQDKKTSSNQPYQGPNKKNGQKQKHQMNHTTDEPQKKCPCCEKTGHRIAECHQFKASTYEERKKFVAKAHLCFKCLKYGHQSKDCKGKVKCSTCEKGHHTLMHWEKTEATTMEGQPGTSKEFANLTVTACSTTIFTTAVIEVEDGEGNWVACRALFDDGASPNCMTQRCVEKLGLQPKKDGSSISTITAPGGRQVQGVVPFKVRSRLHKEYEISDTAFVINYTFTPMPVRSVSTASLDFIKGLSLADPQFNVPGPVDILISNRLYMASLDRLAHLGDGTRGPIARSSRFGWFITGAVPKSTMQGSNSVNEHQVCHMVHTGIDEILERFWKLEEIEPPEYTVEEHKLCVDHFKSTYKLEDGRFTVRLPFNNLKSKLGESYDQAYKRFLSLERRLRISEKARAATNDFMLKYETLGHMSVILPEDRGRSAPAVYLPHHAVIKESSTTTKHRQVFDASARTSTGVALNQALMVGPTRQAELVLRLVKFRCFAIALTGDISMMYRQIWVAAEDRDYQRILWRYKEEDDLQHYRLNTVTYGTASAPFIAVECLQTLGDLGKAEHPIGAKAVKEDFYVDDLVTGAATVQEAIAIYDDVSALVKKGGFELRKWATNCPQLLEFIPEELRDVSPSIAFEDSSTKTLGIKWMHAEDTLKFDLGLKDYHGPTAGWTKRSMASAIASVFDPLGLLAPVVIRLKMFLQQLWLVKLGWDDPVPEEIAFEFEEVYTELPSLSSCVIPRCVVPAMQGGQVSEIEIHGFCDASEKAYGAGIYVVCGTNSRLLISKTRVAPLKKLTIPRLELCAAVLLANLYCKIKDYLAFPVSKVSAWSDNTTVLHWINQDLFRLHTFVCNRVAKINDVLPGNLWSHVRTEDNPSDCASRGIMPSELSAHPLWWTGPEWLVSGVPCKAQELPPMVDDEEYQKEVYFLNFTDVVTSTVEIHLRIIENSSKYWKMVRVCALVNRIVKGWLAHVRMRKSGQVAEAKFRVSVVKPYSPSEIVLACNNLVKAVQASKYAKEIAALEAGLTLSKRPLGSLAPFICKTEVGQDGKPSDGLLRVGGRLAHSDLSLDQKFPIILPADHKFTKALVEEYHLRTLHGGPTLLRSLLGQKYWIVGARLICRSVVKRCIVCFKVKKEAAAQFMSDLPSARVTETRAFNHTGVDYGGHFLVKSRAGRGCKVDKGYIALFVCFATKAVHLEFVSALSTAAFIAAFRRFVATRGSPAVMQSDNGTNFVGAANEFEEIYKDPAFQDVVSKEGITWKTNVPAAPHHGGLWEAGIKQVKKHLARSFGDLSMTFEEWMTAVKQVEACLNSRPLTPMSSDADDLQALTPGHFLIGCPLVSIPEHNYVGMPQNRLDSWQKVQQRTQLFWQRWREEYLSTLQQRPKWWLKKTITVGAMVILKEPSPPCKWKLGVIEEVYPGPDGVVRSVRIRTVVLTGPELKRTFSYYDRPITKLCFLPMDGDLPTSSDHPDAAQVQVEGLQPGEGVAA